jgi:hypothetical protein
MSDDRERTFLARWALRKRAAKAEEAARTPPTAATQAPAAAAPAGNAASAAHAPAAEQPREPALPDLESLQGLQSEYRDFLRPEVDESMRRAAMKKLFADPHFNVMDGLDVYIDDYSKPDPLPQALVRQLVQARGLFLFDEKEKEGDAPPASEIHAASQQMDASPDGTMLPTAGCGDATVPPECPPAGTLSQSAAPANEKDVGKG